jgi:hypothetical protein
MTYAGAFSQPNPRVKLKAEIGTLLFGLASDDAIVYWELYSASKEHISSSTW